MKSHCFLKDGVINLLITYKSKQLLKRIEDAYAS